MPGIVGIDIGGTFTDVVHVDLSTGELIVDKVPSTTGRLHDGIRDGIHRLVDAHGIDEEQISAVVHGTTVATNALLEGTRPRAALVVTRGFGDVLEIGTMQRPLAYDVRGRRPDPAVSRGDVIEVVERLDRDGKVVIALGEDAVAEAVEKLRELDIEAVGICLLFSFINGEHETMLRDAIRKALPGVAVVASVDADPEPREYVRANTTAISASLSPLVSRYIERVAGMLAEISSDPELLVMQSGGGLMRADAVAANAHRMVLSGPAGGVIAAQRLVTDQRRDLVTIDVGGTSSDLCLITDGQAVVEVEPSPLALAPLRAAALKITTVGAGGGSIASVDNAGVLTVGPLSAGSDPGPVCYGRGGSQPTVTDAQAVLGRLSPHGLLGGDMAVDIDAAKRAIQATIASPLGLSWEDAASAIIEVATASMERGLRAVSVEAGRDPGDFALVAYGGSGPLHACELARIAGISTVLVPGGSSAYSAVGLLYADLRRVYSDARPRLAASTSERELGAAFDALTESAETDQVRTEARVGDVVLERSVDMRYIGQRGSIRVPASGSPSGEDLAATFQVAHRREYGYASETDPVEISALRLTRVQNWYERREFVRRRSTTQVVRSRSVHFAETGWVDCPIIDRSTLLEGQIVTAPAVIEDRESTVVLPPGAKAELDNDCLVIEVSTV